MATPSRYGNRNYGASSSSGAIGYRTPTLMNNRNGSLDPAIPNFSKLQKRRMNRDQSSKNQLKTENYQEELEDFRNYGYYPYEIAPGHDDDEFADDMNDEMIDNDDEIRMESRESVGEVGSSMRRKGFSSERNQWNAVRLMENCCYDSSTGNLLSKEMCERNLSNSMKSKKAIDFYDILKFSRSPETLAVSFALYQLNTLTRNGIRSRKEAMATPTTHFDIESAKGIDSATVMPGGKRVRLSMLILPSMCTNWVGPMAVTNAISTITNQIAERDPFLMIYSSPDSDRSTTYPSLSSHFFDSFAALLQSGFRFPPGSESIIALAASVRKTLRNFIDKLRREHGPAKIDKLLDEFMKQFEQNSSFRSSEPAIEDVEQKNYGETWTPRQTKAKTFTSKKLLNDVQNVVHDSEGPGKEPSKKKTDLDPAPAPKRIRRRIK